VSSPTKTSQNVWPTQSGEDVLQIQQSGGTVVAGIDSTGAPFGNLGSGAAVHADASLSGNGSAGSPLSVISVPSSGVPATVGMPQFASYLFSVSGGVVSARNNNTGIVDYSGTDAAVVIRAVLNANALVGGTLHFKNGIYPINSFIRETATSPSWTMFNYAIGIPYNTTGNFVQWLFTGEQASSWGGEAGFGSAQNTNGVIFLVSAGALSGFSGTDVACIFFQRPIPGQATYFYFSNDVKISNIGLRFPSNQTANLIHSCMYAVGSIKYDNINADFVQTSSEISVITPAAGTIGLTSSYSGSGNVQSFRDTYVTGCNIAYDIQSEHFAGETLTSEYCTYAGYFGRGATGGWPTSVVVGHPGFGQHLLDQECAHGWQLGGNMANGTMITLINYTMEFSPGGTAFGRVSNMTEVNSGYTSGFISWSAISANSGFATGALFASGGINFQILCGNQGNPQGWKVIGPTPTVSASQIGLGSTTAASASSGAATLPGNPVGFLEVNIGGTMYKVPYYAT
jgi:hypothetical protein